MKLIAILYLFTLSANPFVETKVYVCGSADAKKYHYKESCRGLKSCKDKIVQITVLQAQYKGLTLCGWED